MKVFVRVITLSLFYLLFLLQSCTVSEDSNCLTSFDCPPNQGFECINNQCVQTSGVVADKDSDIQDSVNDDLSQPAKDKDIVEIEKDTVQETEQIVELEQSPTKDEDISADQCTNQTCNGHGLCYKKNNKPACQCYDSYEGDFCDECAKGFHKKDNFCVENEKCSATFCSMHGKCDDSSGTATCMCNEGYIGEKCDSCASGFQDNDNNGTCEKDCSTANLNCQNPKICNDKSGTAICDCKTGFAGTNCDECASGFHKNGSDCVPNQACKADSCQPNGSCDDSSGTITCHCNEGYSGPLCKSCAKKYQDSNGDGVCKEDCNTTCGQNDGFWPTSHGKCAYESNGDAFCQCDQGWKDPFIVSQFTPECSECNTKNPPKDHPYGCDGDCKDFCNNGNCYIEPSTEKEQCICKSGYHIESGKDKYNGNCVKD